MEFKQCPRCKEILELTPDLWYSLKGRRGGGWSGYCKQCTRKAAARTYPIIITIQTLPANSSLIAALSAPMRQKIKSAKGPVYIHIQTSDTYRQLGNINEELTYDGLLDSLHEQGFTIKDTRAI